MSIDSVLGKLFSKGIRSIPRLFCKIGTCSRFPFLNILKDLVLLFCSFQKECVLHLVSQKKKSGKLLHFSPQLESKIIT